MKNKKDSQQEVVITEIVAWIFVAAVIYIFAKMTFWLKGNTLLQP